MEQQLESIIQSLDSIRMGLIFLTISIALGFIVIIGVIRDQKGEE